jgi:hypothetical protein
VRSLFAAASVALLLAHADEARAYCRTTTVQVPAGYDPAVSGCWTEGAAVAWTSGRVPYSLSAAASRQIPFDEATRVAHLAFGTWNAAHCADGSPNVQTYDNGPISAAAAAEDCGLVSCDPTVHDSKHVIIFRDDAWPHNDPANTLALTTITFGVDSAEIFDADIEINSAQHALSAQEPPPPGEFDLQAILTHEAGHFYGLAHATSSTSVMYAFYQPGAIQLTADDVAGVCGLYQPLPTSDDGACTSAPGSSSRGAAVPVGAFLTLIGVSVCRSRTRLFPWRLRRRSGDPTATRTRADRSPGPS